MPNHYVTGSAIRRLREKRKLTQAQLAAALSVSDKTVSKWETARGLPDITLLEPLARALQVSVPELLSGEEVINANRAGNLLRTVLYVCPVCGNVIHAAGAAHLSCCGVELPPLEAEEADDAHALHCELVEDEFYVTLEHPMTKEHFISFFACAGSDRFELVKLYPEGGAQARNAVLVLQPSRVVLSEAAAAAERRICIKNNTRPLFRSAGKFYGESVQREEM